MRRQELILGVAGLLVGALALTLWLAPRVTGHSPNGSIDSAVQPIAVHFNRRVNPENAARYFHILPPVDGRFTLEGNRLLFTPVQPLDYGQTYTVTLSAGLRGQNGLPLLRGMSWRFQVGYPQLIYLRLDGERTALWATPLHGRGETAVRRLTGAMIDVWDYTVTPNGRSLLLSNSGADGKRDLVLLDVQSGDQRLLLACPDSQCRDAHWQPGGALVAYERVSLVGTSRLPQVWLLDTVSRESWPAHPVDLLASVDIRTLTSRYPRWSADGRYLAYFKTDAHALVVLDITGGEPALIPTNLNEMGSWSPDGYQLVYTELTQNDPELEGENEPGQNEPPGPEEEPSVFTHLIITDLSLETTLDLSEGLAVNDGRPVWRPDGQMIAFTRVTAGSARQIWLLSLAGAGSPEERLLTTDPFHHHTAPSWSPDGRYLAFMRAPIDGRVGQPAIWLYDSETETMNLVEEGAFLPGWLP